MSKFTESLKEVLLPEKYGKKIVISGDYEYDQGYMDGFNKLWGIVEQRIEKAGLDEEQIQDLIRSSEYEDWDWNGEDEVPVDRVDTYKAAESISTNAKVKLKENNECKEI